MRIMRGVRRASRDRVVTLVTGLGFLLSMGHWSKTWAQEPPLSGQPAAALKQGAANVFHAGNEDYRLGTGDVVQIQVEKAPELSGTYRVGSDGTFQMPYLGQLTARSKTPEELSILIADGLRDKYLKNPRVVVDVVQYNSRTFFIQGAVRSPGVYQIEGKPTLLQLINIAGGLAENHGATAFVIRPIRPERNRQGNASPASPSMTSENQPTGSAQEGGAKYDLLKANITGLFKGNFDQDVVIEPGDIVNVPKTELFFVAGEVRKPGSFSQIEGTTLRQAISMAEGTTFKAATNRVIIFRENPRTGKHEEIHVDVGAVMKGGTKDVPILANDIIVVPNSRIKTVTNVLLTGFGSGLNNVVRIPAQF